MAKIIISEFIGKVFGRWTIVSEAVPRRKTRRVKCRCNCGKENIVDLYSVTSGISRSCGCLHRDLARIKSTTHGMHRSAEYVIWWGIKQRCYNPKNSKWHDYGGRGIRMCKRWGEFTVFYADMGPRPSPKHSIDRYPDMNGDYTPENCRWATPFEQARNTRRNVFIEYNGKSQCAKDWAKELGFRKNVIAKRLSLGWSIHDTLTTPVRVNGVTY